MRRLALLLPILLATSACSSEPPTVAEVIEQWPDDIAAPSPAPAAVQEHYRESFLSHDTFAGVDDIEFFTLPEEADVGLSLWAVMVVSNKEGLASDEVNQLRCDFLSTMGEAANSTDDYAGDDGLHGHDGWFSVNTDGTAVLVHSALDEDDAHEVARALGGEDESGTPPCEASD